MNYDCFLREFFSYILCVLVLPWYIFFAFLNNQILWNLYIFNVEHIWWCIYLEGCSSTMAAIPSDLIWEFVKKTAPFLLRSLVMVLRRCSSAKRRTISATLTPSSILVCTFFWDDFLFSFVNLANWVMVGRSCKQQVGGDSARWWWSCCCVGNHEDEEAEPPGEGFPSICHEEGVCPHGQSCR